MLKQLKQLVKNVGIKNQSEISEVLTLGVSITAKCLKLCFSFMRLSIFQKMFYIKYSKSMAEFMLDEGKKYNDVVVRCDIEKLQEPQDMIVALRRQTIHQGLNMPFEIHLYTQDDKMGILGFKYLLTDVREGEDGVNIDTALCITDNKGQVFSYVPLDWETYKDYVKTQKRHFMKSAFCPNEPNMCENIKFIDLEF